MTLTCWSIFHHGCNCRPWVRFWRVAFNLRCQEKRRHNSIVTIMAVLCLFSLDLSEVHSMGQLHVKRQWNPPYTIWLIITVLKLVTPSYPPHTYTKSSSPATPTALRLHLIAFPENEKIIIYFRKHIKFTAKCLLPWLHFFCMGS